MIKRLVFMTLGILFIILGVIGIFIPILPTTPFVLCAAGLFSFSNPKLALQLEKSRYFGEYISSYKKGTGIEKTTKIKSLVFLWAILLISAFIKNTLLFGWFL